MTNDTKLGFRDSPSTVASRDVKQKLLNSTDIAFDLKKLSPKNNSMKPDETMFDAKSKTKCVFNWCNLTARAKKRRTFHTHVLPIYKVFI